MIESRWLLNPLLSEIRKETLLLLKRQAVNARRNSYSPYSKFKVGSSVLTKCGLITCGTNFENQLYEKTVHAEVNAIGQMITMNALSLRCVFVASSNGVKPCMNCRQVIAEFCDHNIPIVLVNVSNNQVKVHTIFELAPKLFKVGQLNLL